MRCRAHALPVQRLAAPQTVLPVKFMLAAMGPMSSTRTPRSHSNRRCCTAASGVLGKDSEDCNEPHEEHGRHGHPLEADDDDDSAGYGNMVEGLVTITSGVVPNF